MRGFGPESHLGPDDRPGARRSVVRRVSAVAMGFLAVALLGCNRDPEECYENKRFVVPPPLGVVPETLVIGDLHLVLQPHLNRDFMPISPPNGRSMTAHIRVVEVDSLPLPSDLDLLHLWVVVDNDCWSIPLNVATGLPEPPFRAAATARCGPKWPPGLRVDTIVRLRQGGRSHLYLRAATSIERSD